MMKWRHRFLQFKRDESGLAFLEFAICTPFILALLLGSVEVTRYILIAQKVEKTSVTISDVVAQAQRISTADLNIIVAAAGQVMKPYSFADNGYVIITSVTQVGAPTINNPPRVNWQYTGGGTWTQQSRIGTTGSAAVLPQDIVLNDKNNVILAEVYYNYTPLVLSKDVITETNIYKVGLYKTRLGDLSTLSFLEPVYSLYRRVVS